MISAGDGFNGSYAEARQRWLTAVVSCQGEVESLIHPDCKGPAGEDLVMDWASFGSPEAARVFLVTSGTHGIEGYAGSAVQCAWLESGQLTLPAGVRLVLVHAVNPWGFAYGHRVTEHNVDLNRNFIDFSSIPVNAGYTALHPHLMLQEWTETGMRRAFEAMDAFRLKHGEKAFSDAFNGGQYDHADGLFYGGRAPQWSNTTFRTQLRRSMGKAQQVHLLDLHTGIGPYGEPFFINFDPQESSRRSAAERVWGSDALSGRGSTHAAFASYRGLLMDAFAEELPQCLTTGVVVEFGTHPRPRMQRAHLTLAWLRRQPAWTDTSTLLEARHSYAEAFIPSDSAWRQQVVARGTSLCAQGLAALASDPFQQKG